MLLTAPYELFCLNDEDESNLPNRIKTQVAYFMIFHYSGLESL
jgi:hypothetical protein